jgi:beta-lactam-binding protein with PASTA domain
MRDFTSLNEFRTWAQEYNINIDEVYEFNKEPKGTIFKYSIAKDAVINPDDTIIVYISNGSPIEIPNFFGKTKASITSTCNSIGLKCSFTYNGYSTYEKDIATSQNKKAGSDVISGTSITIGLSSGIAKTSTLYITESQLLIGNANQTITALKTYFASEYPGVTFIFYKKASSVYNNDGFIHESSPIKDGSKVTQGKSYSIWITEN